MPADNPTLVAQWTVNQYTITFDSAGGSAVDAITQNYGTAVVAPTAPTLVGHTFAGWDPAVPATMPADNPTLVAQWTVNQYTITFDSAGGSAVDAITQNYGTAVVAPADPTRVGHTFAGWDPAVPATMPADNPTLVAQWTVNQYTITFDSAGGSAVDAITQNYGTAVVAPADPTRVGHTFAGWDPAVPATMPADNPTLVAQWTVNQYTITFDSAGGSAVDPITQNYGTAVVAPAAPTRVGHTFAGWDPAVPATMPADNPTLVAQWTVNQYTITFDSAGGSAVDPITQNYGTAVVAPAAPTRVGHTFAGWDPAVPATMPADNPTLVAQWTVNQYTITFDSAGGSAVDAITQNYGTAVVAPADPTLVGHTFAGWDPAVPATMPAENPTLVAQWTVNQYTITFDSAGGSAVDAITQNYGTAVVAPASPTLVGHTFAGWDPAVPATMPADNPTLVAQWTVNQYTITFDSAGGSAVDAITQNYGTAVVAPADPTLVGHTFAGWDPAVPATMPADNPTLVAQWTVNQYTITFDSAGGSAVDAITQNYGTAVVAPADPTLVGHTFAGWDPAVPATMPADNPTLVAQWTVNQYTITFDSAGGSAVDAITQNYGTVVVAPTAPTLVGHTFAGWDPALPATMPADNPTLVAQWTVNQYTITFDSAGGSAVDAITQDYGTAVVAPTAPTLVGHTFAGWDPAVPATMPADNPTLVAQWTVNQYTITFDSAGGSAVDAITQDYGTAVVAPADPTLVGHTFAGWDPAVPATMPADNPTLVAQWTVNQYTITFDSAGGSAVDAITQNYGTAVVAPADPTLVGHTFAGWDPAVPATMPADNPTLVAQWTVNQYTITFDSAGGSAVDAITQNYGTAVVAPTAPTLLGHTFAGWDPAVPATMPADNPTLVAQWTVNQYTITFDSAGGSAVDAITQNYGTAVVAPTAPTLVGHTFAGWDPEVPATMPADSPTLVAQWTVNQYTISFDSAGGSAVDAITQDYGTVVVAPTAPTLVGHTFAGWDPALPATMPADNPTLVAQWTVNQYTITFDSAGGSAVDAITQDYGTAVVAPTAPTLVGHTFAGWDPAVPATMPADNPTLVAQWTVNQYTITFDSAGGSAVDAITQDYGTAVVAPADPTLVGHTFAGWDPAVPATMPADNPTLVAQWTVNQYTITFDSAGGSAVDAITQNYGTAVVAPADPTLVGHTFAGWDPAVPATMPADNPTLVAQWTVNQYTITFDSAGGSAVDAITQNYGTAVVAPTAPTLLGHTFAGWDPAVPATMPADNPTLVAQWTVNQYTITFDSAGGSAVDAITQNYGTAVVAPTAPTLVGHTFAGWDPAVPATMPADSPTLVAQWTVNQYTISFDSAGGSAVDAITQDYGTAVVAPTAPTLVGHTFAGWDPAVPATMPADNPTLVAQWTVNQYTITFDSAGGSAVDPITQNYGTAVVAPAAPTRVGHTFAGWDPAVPATMPADNPTLVAQWTVNQYTITFDSAGGSAVDPITQNYGTAVVAPAAPTRVGHTFAGWDPAVPATMPADNPTLVAQWTVNQYTITFDSAGGSAVDAITQNYGTAVVAPPDPTLVGHTFAGWDPAVPATMPADNPTLVAQWTVNQYTISFDSAGGSAVDAITQNYGTAVVAPADPTLVGHTFAGWDPAVPATMPADNPTLVAQWTVNQYTITFDSAGGSAVDPITQNYGTAVVAPAAPTRVGHTFAGWDPAVPATMPADNPTLVAQWTVNQYTITFDSAGGSAVDAITQNYGTAVVAPPDPTLVGHTFAGWDPAVPATMPADNPTLVAQWTVNQYTITFDSAGGSAVDAITQNYGTAVVAPTAPTLVGHTFAGWDPAVPATMPADNPTLVAQWTVNQYTITFDSDGGSAVDAITQDYGTAVVAPADPTLVGHTFAGWDPAVPATMPADNPTLVAQWTVNQYTITFDSAGGSAVDAITQNYGTAVVAPTAPTLVGHTFAGWDPAVPATMPADNPTLVAQWTVNQYTITFDSAGGSAVDAITQNYGTAVVAPTAPTLVGHTFAGWDPAVPATMPADNPTLVAQWTVNQYTITFDSAGGSAVDAITQDYGTAVVAPTAPTLVGHTFAGWDPAVPATMPADNPTLVAQWTVNQYTITFDSAGGSAVDAITQNYGTAVVAPADPTLVGHTFAGWDPAVPATMPADNPTLVAQWTVNQYTITFDSAGGSAVDAITQNYGTAVVAPTAPTLVGHTFAGWDPEVPATMPADSPTLVAQWTVNQYTITFDSDGGTAVDPITQDYGTAVVAPTAPTLVGHTFAGWDPAVPATMPADSPTLVAQWTVNQYTITFDLGAHGTRTGGGELVQIVEHGDSATAPEFDVAGGWWFTGWEAGFTEVTGDLRVLAGYAETGGSILVHRGVNLSGAEFGEGSLPGTYGTHYIYPDPDTIRYFLAKGMTTVRLPFRWERLQRAQEGALDNTELMRLRTTVETITAAGGTVVLDPHNFAAYGGQVIGTPEVTQAAFADFWGRLAAEFADNQRVVFGLMNEPHDIQATTWLAAANAAIAAIRAADATNLVLVPGANWTSSFSWHEDYGYGVNAETMTGIVDPADRYAVEVHLYFDSDNSGNTSGVVGPTIGRERLAGFVQWCRTHGIRGFLGEVGAPATTEGDIVLADTLDYLETEADDVFLGWTYWAAGQWWPADYRFSIQPADPTDLDLERRQLAVMAPYLPSVHTVEFQAGAHGAIIAGARWQSVPDGGSAAPPTVQADEGWLFSGWDADSTTVLDNLTVTALYERIVHTLTYNAGENGMIDGEQQVIQNVEHGQDGASVTAIPDAGYRFRQWSDGVPTPARTDTNVVADGVFTAEFAVNQYTITFDSGGGSAVNPITQDYGTAVVPPAAPTLLGHTFAGWVPAVPATMPAENPTLIAQWTVNQYTITFDSDGGSAIDPITQNFGTAVVAPADPTLVGYTFAGWEPELPATMPAGDLVLTATYVLDDPVWSVALALVGAAPKTLTFGMHEVATDGLDEGIDAAGPELPLQPGQAALVSDDLSLSYSTDYRALSEAAESLLIASAGADPIRVKWEPPDLPDGKHLTLYEVVLEEGGGRDPVARNLVGNTALDMAVAESIEIPAGESRTYVIRYGDELVFDLAFGRGWNLVSLPIDPVDPAVDAVLADDQGIPIHMGKVQEWSGTAYADAVEIDALVGYWVYTQAPAVILVEGTPVVQEELNLVKGWNLVGPNRLRPVPEDGRIRGNVWIWRPGALRYQGTQWLIPGLGHWINAAEDGTIPLAGER